MRKKLQVYRGTESGYSSCEKNINNVNEKILSYLTEAHYLCVSDYDYLIQSSDGKEIICTRTLKFHGNEI